MEEELSYLLSNGLITDSELTQMRNGTASTELNRALVWFICGREFVSIKKHYGSYDEVPFKEEVVAIEDLSGKIALLESEIASDIEAAQSAITNKLDTTGEEIITNTNSLIEKQDEHFVALSEAFDNIFDCVASLNTLLDELKDMMSTSYETLQGKCNNISKQIIGLDTVSTSHYEDVLQRMQSSTDQIVADHTTSHNSLKDCVSNVSQNLSNLTILINELKASLTESMKQTVDSVTQMCGSTITASSETKDKVQGFLFQVSTLHELTTSLSEKISLAYSNWVQIASDAAGVKLELSSLAYDLGPFVSKITDATVQISHLFDSIPALMLSLSVIKDNQAKYDELVQSLTSIEKRLGVSTTIESVKNISDVVTNVAHLMEPKEVKNGLLS